MSFVVVREVDEEVLCGHQLHDRVPQKFHPLVVAPGQGGTDGRKEVSTKHKAVTK